MVDASVVVMNSSDVGDNAVQISVTGNTSVTLPLSTSYIEGENDTKPLNSDSNWM